MLLKMHLEQTADREKREALDAKRAEADQARDARLDSITKLVTDFDSKNSRPGLQSEVTFNKVKQEDIVNGVPPPKTTPSGAGAQTGTKGPGDPLTTGDLDEQPFVDSLMGKVPKLVPATGANNNNNNNAKGKQPAKVADIKGKKWVDLTYSSDDSDSEIVDPAVADTVKILSTKIKHNKKVEKVQKKLKNAKTFAEWSWQILKMLEKIMGLENAAIWVTAYIGILLRVNWLAKHEGWAIAHCYGKMWCKLADKAQTAGGAPPVYSALDTTLHTKAQARAKKEGATNKGSGGGPSGSNGKLSDRVAAAFPCENCDSQGHWAHECPKACRYCKAAPGSHSCRQCSQRPGGAIAPKQTTGQNSTRGAGRGGGGTKTGAQATGFKE